MPNIFCLLLPVAWPGVEGDWAVVGRGGQTGVEQSKREQFEDTFGKSRAGVVKVMFVSLPPFKGLGFGRGKKTRKLGQL